MLKNGCVVRSVAGHDRDKFYVVVDIDKEYVTIADGRLRKLERPKRKNVKHIRTTKTILDLTTVNTNKRLRAALRPLNEALAQGGGKREEGGN